jgi:AmmeMemoRadiSam system protein B
VSQSHHRDVLVVEDANTTTDDENKKTDQHRSITIITMMGSAASRKIKMKAGDDDDDGGYSRRAQHAGSWYSNNTKILDEKLSEFLAAANDSTFDANSTASTTATTVPLLRGILCPHAGYAYSGPTAAFSYKALKEELARPSCPIKRILVLHPSHHVYLPGCAVSGASVLETPLGNLQVDDDLRNEILQLGTNTGTVITVMEQDVDEQEHSGEMQYPFIAKSLPAAASKAISESETNNNKIKVLPLMCGNISTTQEQEYGKLLAPIVARPDVLCVISTDFCHWGSRFQFQPTGSTTSTGSSTTIGSTTTTKIFEHIHELDHQGMRHIELQEPGAFATYLKQTKNTICGRHAIAVWLHAVQHNNSTKEEALEIQFVRYDQSSEVRSMRDSSVSYASAVARRV